LYEGKGNAAYCSETLFGKSLGSGIKLITSFKAPSIYGEKDAEEM
jgi:hypothetical protein